MNRRTVLFSLLSLPFAEALFADESKAPGDPETSKTKLLEAGAELFQSDGPLKAIHVHVCGFHFYNGDLGRQVLAHHYCAHRSEDFMQCVIYDSAEKNARLIGIEYIISAKLFATLPEEEKPLWHSHNFEVKSGQLTAPGIPEAAEIELMKDLVGTYGKTTHTWQVDRFADVPLGAPQLMMGFTKEGQLNERLNAEREKAEKISTKDQRAKRTSIPDHQPDPAADSWQSGKAWQLKYELVVTKAAPGK